MAELQLAMDAAFWNLGVSTSRTLDGTAKSVPGEPAPLDDAWAGYLRRPEQLAVLRRGFPLGIVPSFLPPPSKGWGFFSFQTLIPCFSTPNWWTALMFQFRPRKVVSKIKADIMAAFEAEVLNWEEIDLIAVKDISKIIGKHVKKHATDKSLCDLGLFSEFSLLSNTKLMFNIEGHGDTNECRTKATILHQLEKHDITIEAASPELFLDHKGTYWNSPLSLSFDVASIVYPSGLRYRFGLHRNTGHPQVLNSSSGDAPLALLPGVCAKSAFSYEKSKDFWREINEINEITEDEDEQPEDRQRDDPYDVCLKEPHSALSGIIGGSFATWFGGGKNLGGSADLTSGETQVANTSERKRSPVSADLFGSLCYTYQQGKFTDDFNDLTRVDARLDIPSATSFLKGTWHLISDPFRKPVKREVNPLSSPRLSLILQQQVAGPIVFRVDTRFSFNSPYCFDDILFGLSYHLRLFESGKVFAWYSPKRQESKVELRLFEF